MGTYKHTFCVQTATFGSFFVKEGHPKSCYLNSYNERMIARIWVGSDNSSAYFVSWNDVWP